MEKLAKHMRIAALQCNFEGGRDATMKVPKLWESAGFNVEQLLHTHAELYSAVFDREKHGALLKEYLAEESKRGLGTILYMNCHILLTSQEDMAPDWAIQDKDGSYILRYGTYKGCCLNSSWLDYFLSAIEELAEYQINGIFFDGPIKAICYCPRCRSSFSAQYEKSMDNATDEELDHFAMEQYLRAKEKFYAKTKEVNPDWIAYYNESFHLMDLEQMKRSLNFNDIFGTEGGFRFYGSPKNAPIWRCALSAKMAEAVAGGKPTVIFIAGDHKPWAWYMHTPAETTLCHASTIANGASVWYGIHGSTDMLDSDSGRKMREIVQFDKKYDHLYQDTESLAELAIFHSFDTGKYYSASNEESDFYRTSTFHSNAAIGNYSLSCHGAVAATYRTGCPFDILTEINLDRINRYALVILPTAACMNEETATAIRDYVRNGGTVIADSETSLYTDRAEKRDNFLLADLFGCDFRQYRHYNPFDYFEFEERYRNIFGDGVKRIPAPLTALDIVPADDCEIMARLSPSLPGCYAGKPGPPEYPYILKNRFGKGTAYYLAGTYFELYAQYGIAHYKMLLQYFIREHVHNGFAVLDAPESLEVTVRNSQPGNERLVHLVNYTGGMNRPITKPAPLHGLRLQLDGYYTVAKALVSNTDLSAQLDDNGIINLPVINEFEVILLKNRK